MNNLSQQYIKRMIEVSKKKQIVLQDILLLTMAQTEAIETDGMEGLERLLENKQKKIEVIDRLDLDFSTCFTKIKDIFNVESLEDAKMASIEGVNELKRSIEKILEILKEISGVEKQNSDKVKNIMTDLSGRIKRINQGKKVNSLYNGYDDESSSSYFIDKKK
ncbi:UNVERIFIED_CONTAM: FlgN protein [Acetivibrio alkalicellulosi]